MEEVRKKLLIVSLFIFAITTGIVLLITDNLEIETTSSTNNVITLDENPTTGFTWQYIIEDTKILKVTSDSYTENKSKENIVGAGGVHTWYLEGLEQGTTTIKFDLYRTWEGIDKSIETVAFLVKVSPDLKIEEITKLDKEQ